MNKESIKNKLNELRLMSDDVLIEYIGVLMLSGKTMDETRDDLASVLTNGDKLEKLLIWLYDDTRHDNNIITKDVPSHIDTRLPSVHNNDFSSDFNTPKKSPTYTSSSSKATTLQRCPFWPMCRFGDDCMYFHPTELCRNFPYCRYGSSCLYIHPANTAAIKCRYGANCCDSRCLYAHPSRRAIRRVNRNRFNPTSRPAKKVSEIPCRFQAACKRPNCPYLHDMKMETDERHIIEIKDDQVPVVKVESDDETFLI